MAETNDPQPKADNNLELLLASCRIIGPTWFVHDANEKRIELNLAQSFNLIKKLINPPTSTSTTSSLLKEKLSYSIIPWDQK